LAAGADQELVGILDEAKELGTFVGTYYFLNTVAIILLDARVLHGPMAESLINASSLGFYILFIFVRSVGGPPGASHDLSLPLSRLPCALALSAAPRSHIRPSIRHRYAPTLAPCWLSFGTARVTPAGSDKQSLTAAGKGGLRGLGSSLRDLMRVVQVRAPPPRATHGVQHQIRPRS
jgi:hypothetical protein